MIENKEKCICNHSNPDTRCYPVTRCACKVHGKFSPKTIRFDTVFVKHYGDDHTPAAKKTVTGAFEIVVNLEKIEEIAKLSSWEKTQENFEIQLKEVVLQAISQAKEGKWK